MQELTQRALDPRVADFTPTGYKINLLDELVGTTEGERLVQEASEAAAELGKMGESLSLYIFPASICCVSLSIYIYQPHSTNTFRNKTHHCKSPQEHWYYPDFSMVSKTFLDLAQHGEGHRHTTTTTQSARNNLAIFEKSRQIN